MKLLEVLTSAGTLRYGDTDITIDTQDFMLPGTATPLKILRILNSGGALVGSILIRDLIGYALREVAIVASEDQV